MPHPGPLIPRRPHTSSTITVTATQLREHLTCPPTRTSHPSRVLITAAGAGVAHARGHYGTAGTVGPIGVGACRPHDHELSVRHTRPAPYRHPPSHPSEIRTPMPRALIDGPPSCRYKIILRTYGFGSLCMGLVNCGAASRCGRQRTAAPLPTAARVTAVDVKFYPSDDPEEDITVWQGIWVNPRTGRSWLPGLKAHAHSWALAHGCSTFHSRASRTSCCSQGPARLHCARRFTLGSGLGSCWGCSPRSAIFGRAGRTIPTWPLSRWSAPRCCYSSSI